MSAAAMVQAAAVAALAAAPGLAEVVSGVFDGPPDDAVLPYVAIDGGGTTDWSHKTARGREHRLVLTVWERRGRAERLRALMAAAEVAIEALPRQIGPHRIASLTFLRDRVARGGDGPWAGLVEYRVRTLER